MLTRSRKLLGLVGIATVGAAAFFGTHLLVEALRGDGSGADRPGPRIVGIAAVPSPEVPPRRASEDSELSQEEQPAGPSAGQAGLEYTSDEPVEEATVPSEDVSVAPPAADESGTGAGAGTGAGQTPPEEPEAEEPPEEHSSGL